MDWILARLNENGEPEDFVAVEVQSIDTTGNYRNEQAAHASGVPFEGSSTAGLNWENVNKRILPQLIYKGHVLRHERLCTKGLFFVCPAPVYNKISERLGGQLPEYPIQAGSLTFMWYDVGEEKKGAPRDLLLKGTLTTTTDQVSHAFAAPTNLPAANVYETAIKNALGQASPR